MRIEILLARPQAFETWRVDVPIGATLADALGAAELTPAWLAGQGIDGFALHGVRAEADARLRDGDRIELLRPLVADPKDARRRRAAGAGGKP